MPRYKRHSAADVEAGQKIRVVNRSRGGETLLTIEGEVERTAGRKNGEEHIPMFAHFVGGAATSIVSDTDWINIGLDVILPDLPTYPGSAIKIYDVNLLRDRLAVLRKVAPRELDEPAEVTWEFADTGTNPSHSDLQQAEIVFDGDPNAH
jgi:hypothetical protein